MWIVLLVVDKRSGVTRTTIDLDANRLSAGRCTAPHGHPQDGLAAGCDPARRARCDPSVRHMHVTAIVLDLVQLGLIVWSLISLSMN